MNRHVMTDTEHRQECLCYSAADAGSVDRADAWVVGARYSRPMRSFLLLILAAISASAQTIGIDTHIDTAQRLLIEGVDLTQQLKDGAVDIPRLREGGMNAPFFALWVPTFYKGAEAVPH